MDHSPFPFERLPAELQYEILSQLDWRDVLRLRQVSRRSYHSSKERTVWVAIFRRTASISPSQQFNLDKRLELHSASELEAAVLASKRADLVLNSAGPTQRIIHYQQGDSFLTLLDGGRWAIAWAASLEELVYYDLASPNGTSGTPPRTVLLTNPYPSTLDGAYIPSNSSVDVEIIGSSPYPAFNVAIYFAGAGSYPGHLHVWSVVSQFNEEGQVVGLSGTLLSSFFPQRLSHKLRLSTSYVTYIEASAGTEGTTCVVEWAQADGRGSAFPRRYLNRVYRDVWALPNGYAFSPDFDNKVATVYDLAQIEETTKLFDCTSSEMPHVAWRASLPCTSPKPHVFGPVYTSDEIHFVTSLLHPQGEDIHNGIILPLNRASGRPINFFRITPASIDEAWYSLSLRTLMAGIIHKNEAEGSASLLRYFWDPVVPGRISLKDSEATLRIDDSNAPEADRFRRYMDTSTLTMIVPFDNRTASILSFSP